MMNRTCSRPAAGCLFAVVLCILHPLAAAAGEPAALRLVSSRVSLAGTSNVHDYTASTTAARLVRMQLATGAVGDDVWDSLFEPGALAFEISIPAASLSSPRDGLDKNMHKALKVTEHPEITFRLSRFEAAPGTSALRGVGVLKIAGVEREVILALKTQRTGTTLVVTGEVHLVMTDFGITPPKAMLGMLKTDPRVTVSFETVFGFPSS